MRDIARDLTRMTNCFTQTPLWGGLFADDDVAQAFSAPRFCKAMVRVELAWTKALAHVGAVSPEAATRVGEALQEFEPDLAALGAGSARDGLPVVDLVRQMRALCDPQDASAVHSGATSQDIIDTAMVLTCLDVIALFRARLQNLVNALHVMEAEQGHRVLMARTRMQAALPIPVAARLAAWRSPLTQHLGAINDLSRTLSQAQFGGPVGQRDAPDGQGQAAAEHAASELGLTLGPVWHSDRARFVHLGHWLTLVAGSLGKLSQDLCLMAQQGVEEVRFQGLGSSSAMPHKQNPVRAELVVALARFVAGQQAALSQALIHEQERSGTAWALEWLTLPAMFEATGAALTSTGEMLAQIVELGSEATP